MTKQDTRTKVLMYVEAAYLHGLPVENLDTGELESPRDIADVAWIADKIMELLEEQQR